HLFCTCLLQTISLPLDVINYYLENKKVCVGWSCGCRVDSFADPGWCQLPFNNSLAVVALESLSHEKLAEILRGKLLHILAIVVDLS
ncbi:hypothetical protein DKP78_21095, partial [Enterococcus faecium]